MTLSHRKSILIIEDSPEDFEMTVRAFRKCGLDVDYHHCGDGDEALEYLMGSKSDDHAPTLIFLDLNLPGTDGREVLEQIKSHPQLKGIPVIVLTTSKDPRDIDRCYRGGANSYIQKPVDLPSLFSLIATVKEYWFDKVLLDPQ